MSDSVRPHRRQPTRLPHPWDSPGKNTRVGCHFLLQSMKVKSESEVAQSCPTLRNPMDCSLPGSSIHGIFQQEYWSGVPLPSLHKDSILVNNANPLSFKNLICSTARISKKTISVTETYFQLNIFLQAHFFQVSD